MNLEYSFIIPAYNEEALIGQSLDALKEAARVLAGTYEIVVVDDASTDRTGEIARKKGARVIEVKKRQIAAVRNAGAVVAAGKVFVFIDADTWATTDALREMERLLQKGVVAGGARLAFDRPPSLGARLFAWVFLTIYFAVGLAAGGFIFARREAFQAVGGFDEKYFAGEEIHLSRALKKQGKMRIIKYPVITSARKFRMKSLREHGALLKNMIRKGKKGWEQREGLDMWYDGTREK